EYEWDNAVGVTVYRKLEPPAIQTPQTTQESTKDGSPPPQATFRIDLAELGRDRSRTCKMCFDHATSSFFKCQTCDDFAVCRDCVGQARHSFSWESESEAHLFEEIHIPSLQSRFEELQALALLAPGTDGDVPQEAEDNGNNKNNETNKGFLEIPVGCCFLCFDRRPGTVEMAWLESSDHHVSSHGWSPPSAIYTSDLRMAADRRCMVCSLTFRGLLLMEPEAEERDSRISLESVGSFIQDDAVDWEIESSKMCDVFSQAHLVIISASAAGDHEGFLGKRPVAYQGLPLEFSEGSGVFDAVVRREMPHTKTLDSGHRFPLAGSHIESRAWCMQETFLARRSVTFNDSEMVWECRSRAACECGTMSEDFTSPNPQPRFRTGLRKAGGKERFYWVVGPDHPSLEGAPRTFGPLVLGHSFLSPSHKFQYFTRPLAEQPLDDDDDGIAARAATDRLPALSGLASAAALRCNDTYIAGLWKEDLQLGLLWSVDGDPTAPPSEYLAPSFSFASVNRPVVYNLPNRLSQSGENVYGNTGVKLLAVDLVRGRDPFGMVLGGSILVSGLSSKRRLILKEDLQNKGNDDSNLSAKEDGSKGTWKYYWDTEAAAVPLLDRQGDQSNPRFTLNRAEAGPAQKNVGLELYLLLVADVSCVTEDNERRVEGAGLLLAPSATEEGAYQRLGLVITSHTAEGREKWVQELTVREFRIV
ncbi:heterokaryon incompatibility protein, partial [Colletotrichum musicola]